MGFVVGAVEVDTIPAPEGTELLVLDVFVLYICAHSCMRAYTHAVETYVGKKMATLTPPAQYPVGNVDVSLSDTPNGFGSKFSPV